MDVLVLNWLCGGELELTKVMELLSWGKEGMA